MTYTTTPRFAQGEFRIGSVISRSWSVLSRNFLIFFVVMAVAYLPTLLLTKAITDVEKGTGDVVATFFGVFLMLILSVVSQAVIVYAAFQDMRGQPVRLGESIGIALERFVPIIILAIVSAILMGLGMAALIVPGVILFTMWFVATPVCVVEKLGPLASLKRSAQLTKGHRWKILGLMLLMVLISIVVAGLTTVFIAVTAGPLVTAIAELLWNAVWYAFYAISVVVAYHDLRVVKEGIGIDQIAAVFD
jgi:hypothetical protein